MKNKKKELKFFNPVITQLEQTKTTATAINSKGVSECFDITGTEIEKDFTKLLKKLKRHQLETAIIGALDISTYEET